MLESFPPQCGGPELIGWDWDAVSGFEQAGQARWGEFVVIGTYAPDGDTFTLTRPALPAEEYDGTGLGWSPDADPVWHSPCPEPDGGWRVLDPALTSEENLHQTARRARARSDFGGLWLDQSINPAATDPSDATDERRLNDPARLILNVAVTGDPNVAEVDLRESWGGALCVSRVRHTERQLRRIQRQVSSLPGLLSATLGTDRVEVTVVWDDGSLQDRLDNKYGTGVIAVTSALRPFGP